MSIDQKTDHDIEMINAMYSRIDFKFGPARLFDISDGVIVVEEIAEMMTSLSNEQKKMFLDDVRDQTISVQSSGNRRKYSKSLYLKAFLMVLDFLE